MDYISSDSFINFIAYYCVSNGFKSISRASYRKILKQCSNDLKNSLDISIEDNKRSLSSYAKNNPGMLLYDDNKIEFHSHLKFKYMKHLSSEISNDMYSVLSKSAKKELNYNF